MKHRPGRWAPAWLALILISAVIEMFDRSDTKMDSWFLLPALAGVIGLVLAAVALWRRWSNASLIAFAAASLAALLYAVETMHTEASGSELLLALLWAGVALAVPSVVGTDDPGS